MQNAGKIDCGWYLLKNTEYGNAGGYSSLNRNIGIVYFWTFTKGLHM